MATQYSCLENSMDRGACYNPWGHKEPDTTEHTHTHTHTPHTPFFTFTFSFSIAFLTSSHIDI